MKALFHAENRIDNSYNRQHITYLVDLKKDYKKIKLDFEYNPKFIDDEKRAKEIIIDVMENQLIGEEKEREEESWEKYKKLKNLITISVDDNNGFRGCAHRKDQFQEHLLSVEGADIGFIPGIIPKGNFEITISVHAMVTDECNYKVNLWDMEDNDD